MSSMWYVSIPQHCRVSGSNPSSLRLHVNVWLIKALYPPGSCQFQWQGEAAFYYSDQLTVAFKYKMFLSFTLHILS